MNVVDQSFDMNIDAQNIALELSGVRCQFGALVAVDDFNMTLGQGERRAILGSNGAGKTTLFNLITGDYPVSFGSIKFFGQEVSKLTPQERVRRGLRRTYQISLLFGNLSVLDNVYLACRGVVGGRFSLLKPKVDEPALDQAVELVEQLHLNDVIDANVSELSHGQQRQLEIALALAGDPKLILFDEPAAGLSPMERGDLVSILTQLPASIGFIIIEHDMDVALRVSESVTMMHSGRIFKEGSPSEIENDDEVQALYLGVNHD